MNYKIRALVLCAVVLGFSSAHAAYVAVNDATKNTSLKKAFNLDPYFDKASDVNIGNQTTNISTSFFHASVNAVTNNNGSMDWYSFTTNSANTLAVFDIDRGMPDLDSWIKLYNSTGGLIDQNDDGGILDLGSTNAWDSFLSRVLTTPGLYYLSVGRYTILGQANLKRGQDYTLHVSLAAPEPAPASTVPVPAAAWLFGSAFAGLISFSRKKLSKA
jgi:hypothetical protein